MNATATEETVNNLVSEVISTWQRRDHAPDAQQILQRHPDLWQYKSLALDLVYEEYCLRRESGEQIMPSTFCDRFPTLRKSLRRLIDVHQYMETNRELVGMDDVPWPAVGDQFAGFLILRELGRGAFARVFLARQLALGGRLVAIKVSPYGGEEAETLGKLVHPHIVPVHSVDHDPNHGLTVVCMPYLGNATLSDVLDLVDARGIPQRADQIRLAIAVSGQRAGETQPIGKRWPGSYVEGIVALLAKLADALHYAHQNGVLHRDLKPSNVLLTRSLEPMLLDFNLSSDAELNVTRVGGTLPYMPPEQIRHVFYLGDHAQDARGDARSDVFALGVMAYELLSGKLPFGQVQYDLPAADAASQLLDAQQNPVPSLRTLNPAVDRQLEAVVHGCLNLDPARRPQSAEELAQALRHHQRWTARCVRWTRRHVIATAAILLIVLSLSVAAGYLAMRPPLPERAYAAALEALADHDGRLALEHVQVAIEHDIHNADYLTARAQAYVYQREFKKAFYDLQQVMELRPDASGRTQAWLGYCANMSGMNDAAHGYYTMAVEMGVESASVFSNFGQTCRLSHLPSEAQWYFDRALSVRPNLQMARFNRALLFSTKATDDARYYDQAIEDLKQAEQIGPDFANLHLVWAHLLAEKGAPESAIFDQLKRALEEGATGLDLVAWPSLFPYAAELQANLNAGSSQRRSAHPDRYVPPEWALSSL